jgi:peptidoglycan-associated lipoprotein
MLFLRWVGVLTAVTVASMQPAMAQEKPKTTSVDVAITYDAVRANHSAVDSFWMQGGAVELGVGLYRKLGVAARIEGLHSAPSTANGVPLSMVVVVVGPRYRLTTRGGKYALFGEGLVGYADGFRSQFSENSGSAGTTSTQVTTNANALAIEAGGGVDVRLSRKIAIRPIEASYLRTQFPNFTTNVQNSLRVGAGIVFMLSR